ncbi:MAG: hypothetical protein IJ309_04035 [Clostridia bacterium]|nr:hypothetical protein [Clostridia bacterium]
MLQGGVLCVGIIRNGRTDQFVDWLDTSGSIINAFDGGIIFADGKHHWYGRSTV